MSKARKKNPSVATAKSEGERAYLLGRELTACPYVQGTAEYELWVEGWCNKDEEFCELDSY